MKKIYLCGPTVYNNPHIGNLRPIIIFDILVRSLRAMGEEVYFIHNITDIDDKIIDKAIEEETTEQEISSHYTKVYLDLLNKYNVQTPNYMPKVTENMDEIIDFISKLVELNYAYESNGSVYFSVEKDSKYGSISNRELKQITIKTNEDKQNQNDFALWKNTSKGIQFNSPWGKGRPGWHTECAAFVNEIGELDLHAGGNDLIFPHHENEASQFRVLNNMEITKKWFHIGQINLNNNKMSKSSGNIIESKEFLEKYGNKTLRMLFLLSTITGPIEITEEKINQAKEKIEKFLFRSKEFQLEHEINISNATISKHISEFNFPAALKVLNENSKNANQAKEFLGNLFLLGFISEEDILTKKEKEIYSKWIFLKKEKNYKEADAIKDILISKKIVR